MAKRKPKTPGGTSGQLVPQKHGGALRVGGGGTGAGGRPPDEFRAKMRELASSPEALTYLEECVNGLHGPKASISAWAHITERGYGKMPLPVEGTPGKPLEVKLIVSRGSDE